MSNKAKFWALVPPLPAQMLGETVRSYEALGIEGIWTPQVFGAPFVTLAAAAAQTTTLKLGSGIAQAFARSPLETACSAMDLDLISGGRCVLGIGPSSKECIENWHGAVFGKPLTHLREVVTIVRSIIAAGHTGSLGRFDTEYYKLDLSGLGLHAKPLRTSIPIYLPAVFEPACALAAELGDGLPGHPIWTERWIRDKVLPAIERGLARGGRRREDFDLNLWCFAAPNPDRREAREDARRTVAFYLQMPQYHRYFEFVGVGAQARAAVAAAAARDDAAALHACTDDVVDTIAMVGPPEELRGRLERLVAIGNSVTLCVPFYGLSAEKSAWYSRAIAEAFYCR